MHESWIVGNGTVVPWLDLNSWTSSTPPLGLLVFVEVWIRKRLDYKLEENETELEEIYTTEKINEKIFDPWQVITSSELLESARTSDQTNQVKTK